MPREETDPANTLEDLLVLLSESTARGQATITYFSDSVRMNWLVSTDSPQATVFISLLQMLTPEPITSSSASATTPPVG
jgi:hypothetical protein